MNNFQTIAKELSQASEKFPDSVNFMNLIDNANKIFIYGLGRSGLAIKMFAMRLSQMDYQVNVVGEITNDPIGEKDLLIIASGSGETSQAVLMAKKAKQFKAKIALITTKPDSTIAKQADEVLQLAGKVKGEMQETTTIQPMGALFEQALLIYTDGIILDLMKKDDRSEKAMFAHHANLE